jgi:hypothetical protein
MFADACNKTAGVHWKLTSHNATFDALYGPCSLLPPLPLHPSIPQCMRLTLASAANSSERHFMGNSCRSGWMACVKWLIRPAETNSQVVSFPANRGHWVLVSLRTCTGPRAEYATTTTRQTRLWGHALNFSPPPFLQISVETHPCNTPYLRVCGPTSITFTHANVTRSLHTNMA